MTDPQLVLTERVRQALGSAFGSEYATEDPLIRPSQFADYQANVALSLAKRLRRAPREVAQAIADHLDTSDVSVEVSGPGFLNLTLRDGWIAEQAGDRLLDDRLGVPQSAPQTVIVDYSAPNAAKEMHVGHLRTTIVGDTLARTHEHVGNQVIRQNHLGDWGTQFGMLIEHLLDIGEERALGMLAAGDGNAFYQAARHKFDNDSEFQQRSRGRVPLLQGGDLETLRLWREFVDYSNRYFTKVYRTLGVTLTDDDIAGESKYNPMLADVCDELERMGVAELSEGALCVFPPGFTGRDDQPLPLIVRKSDGGYGYATTDLAAIRHRVRDLKADRVLYVVGATQSLHFQMVFAAARMAAGCTTRSGRSTSRSAACSAATARCSRPAAASRSSSPASSKRPSSGPRRSSPTAGTSRRPGGRSPARSAWAPSSTPTCRSATTASTSSTSTACSR